MLRRLGKLSAFTSLKSRAFSTTIANVKGEQQSGIVKPVNLCTAINQALHIALETDPRGRSLSSNSLVLLPGQGTFFNFRRLVIKELQHWR